MQRVRRVRAAVAGLDLVFTYAAALGGSNTIPYRVAQLPFQPGDRWLALEQTGTIPGGRLSLVLHLQGRLDPAQPIAGLLIDEWTEVIPAASAMTGLAFQYDRPNAQAPQALLLTVPAFGQQDWTVDTLSATLLDTIDLAKVRMVDSDSLRGAGQFLPALYFAFNPNGDTLSLDFRRVVET